MVIGRGDGLVLYTDGVVEPPDAQGRVRAGGAGEIARGCLARPAADTLRAVVEATRSFSGREQHEDDCTLVVVRHEDARAL